MLHDPKVFPITFMYKIYLAGISMFILYEGIHKIECIKLLSIKNENSKFSRIIK